MRIFFPSVDDVCKLCDADNQPCEDCNYYMISRLRDDYPDETAELYEKIKAGTIKELNENNEV